MERRIRHTKISIDEYYSFSQTRHSSLLTVDNLNQILHMHGFVKLHKKPKKVLMDAVDSLDILAPSRSTIRDNDVDVISSSSAFIRMEDVIHDLADLGWQECSVTSLETLTLNPNSCNNNGIHGDDGNIKLEDATSPPVHKRKRNRSRTRKRISVDANSTPIAVPKRKRSRKRMMRLAALNGSTSGTGVTPANGGEGQMKLPTRRKGVVIKSEEFGATTSTVW